MDDLAVATCASTVFVSALSVDAYFVLRVELKSAICFVASVFTSLLISLP